MNSRIIVALLVGVISVPAGYAVAQSGQAGSVSPTAEEKIEAMGLVPEEGTFDPAAEDAAEVDHFIEGKPPQSRIAECRTGKSAMAADACDLAIAVYEGRLEPGEYSNGELRTALDAGGQR